MEPRIVNPYSRRKFIYNVGLTAFSLQTIATLPIIGCGEGGETKTQPAPISHGMEKKLGIALVGLGNYSTGQLAPALQETQQCYLAGIVTGSPDKAKDWKELAGGGPLMDVGIYCVQGVRYTTGLEPVAVRAKEGPKKNTEKFKEVEESLTWQMEMPGGLIAECKCSYSEEMNLLRAEGEKGWFELSPAYGYDGIKGKTSEGAMNLLQVNQQAKQMDDFAVAVMTKRATPVPEEMGRQDVKILQAIYEAMRTGKRVEIGK